jgi:16S rRNA (guanine966-N2)-methyltransferase
MRGVDIAFIDPPYDFAGWDALLAVLDVPLVIAESDEPIVAPVGWEAVRVKRYGRTHVTTLERVG